LPDLLAHILIRRTRNHILRWYGYDSVTHQPVDPLASASTWTGTSGRMYSSLASTSFFLDANWTLLNTALKTRIAGFIKNCALSGETTQNDIRSSPSRTHLCSLWFVALRKDREAEARAYASLHRAGANLRGLIRVLLFKRFESSVFAFQRRCDGC